MRRAGLIGAILLLAAGARAGVSIRKDGANRRVLARTYEALVEADGCLTSLRVGGVEFLAAGAAGSRGAYLYQGGVLKLGDVRRAPGRIVTARSDRAAIRYAFTDDGMEWTVTNRTRSGLVLFLVFAAGLDAVAQPGGRIARPAVNESWPSVIVYRDGARLEIDGADRQWGPWSGPHQVCEMRIEPGRKRKVSFLLGPARAKERKAVRDLLDPFRGRDALLLSPRPYQVVQRRTLESGEVLVSGRLRVEAESVQVRIEGEPRQGRLEPGWIDIPLDRRTRGFSGRLDTPAGGWYRLRLRATRGGQTVAETEVAAFGVGEVFLGAGQSNSTNSGQFRTRQKSGMVSSFNGKAWRLADDPQWGVHDRSGGGSFWPAFGDALVEHYGVPVGVAVTGHGGTSVDRWQPEGELFAWMMTRIHQLGPGGFRALLWHQGESDVGMDPDVYYEKLRRVIEESKSRAGWEFPWFVAQATYHNAARPQFEAIREAQARLWKDGVALQGPDTDKLTAEFRDHEGKGIHFSPKGLKAHGRLWAARILAWLRA